MIKQVIYITAVSSVLEPIKLRVQFNQHLLGMTESASEALALQAQAAEAEAAAEELMAQSEAEKIESASLESSAAALEAESAADAAEGAALEAESFELADLAATEQLEMESHFSKAAAEDLIAKEEMAAGTEMGQTAAESELKAHGGEATATVCQFVPFFDLFCDFIGGISATAFEVAAAAEAAEAAADFAAAAAAKTKEDAEIALALELQEKSAADAALSTEYQSEANLLEEKAEAEELEGEADEAAAKELASKSVAEQTAAEQQQFFATETEARADKAAKDSILQGIESIGVLVAQILLSAVLLAFLVFRLLFKFVIPLSISNSSTTESKTWVDGFACGASTVILCATTWFLVAVTYDSILNIQNTTARGGTIIQLSLYALLAQTLLIFLPAHLITRRRRNWLRTLLIMALDLVLVFGWNALSCFVFSDFIEPLPLQTAYIVGPLLLILTIWHHYWQYNRRDMEVCMPKNDADDNLTVATEVTTLLEKSYEENDDVSFEDATGNESWFEQRHVLMFEMLLSSVLVALLWSCLSRAMILQPFAGPAKNAFVHFLLEWKWYLCGIAATILFLVTTINFTTHWIKRRGKEADNLMKI